MRDTEPTTSMQRERPSTPPDRPKEETARLGDEIYERDIRQQVEADHHGDVVAIDVESGNWAIGDNVICRDGQSLDPPPGRARHLVPASRAPRATSPWRASPAEG